MLTSYFFKMFANKANITFKQIYCKYRRKTAIANHEEMLIYTKHGRHTVFNIGCCFIYLNKIQVNQMDI